MRKCKKCGIEILWGSYCEWCRGEKEYTEARDSEVYDEEVDLINENGWGYMD